MANRPYRLSVSQANAIDAILTLEFVPVIVASDPTFVIGYSAVRGWARERQQELLAHPLFETHTDRERQLLAMALDRRFRNFYRNRQHGHIPPAPVADEDGPQV
ncbi:unnamed protein product [Peniophora sp. CBMAI 1063]|nr:unnamed protein product [Peniophora sp. CBMAI 1063]